MYFPSNAPIGKPVAAIFADAEGDGALRIMNNKGEITSQTL
ncbi:MAG: hypothetical protein ACI9GC_001487 [Phycisphaerales bacterium]|jgi:hypothetical protein